MRSIPAIFMPLVVILSALRLIAPGQAFVGIYQYCLVLALVIVAFRFSLKIKQQRRLQKSFIFLAVGDLFLVLAPALSSPPINFKLGIDLFPFGVLAFAVAYGLMISVYLPRISKVKPPIWPILPILAVFILEISLVSPYTQGILLIGLLIFGVELCLLAWSGISLVRIGAKSSRTAQLLALSALLIVAGDFLVGFNQFYPLSQIYGGFSVHLLDAAIALIYLPGWLALTAGLVKGWPEGV